MIPGRPKGITPAATQGAPKPQEVVIGKPNALPVNLLDHVHAALAQYQGLSQTPTPKNSLPPNATKAVASVAPKTNNPNPDSVIKRTGLPPIVRKK